MRGPYFYRDDCLLPISEATVPLDDINFSYGFGVYETLKVRRGLVYFADMHEERLYHSADIIGLTHNLSAGTLVSRVASLVKANQISDANLKVLLVGDAGVASPAHLYILALNPLFPKRVDYRQGARVITASAERQFPQAKSLNMMVSAMIYRRACAVGAYDALMINRHGCITEGTRTNFFVTDGQVIYTPPADEVLEGVTKLTVSRAIVQRLHLELRECPLPLNDISRWSGAFLTSTSSKVMPLRAIDQAEYIIPPIIRTIMEGYNDFLREYAAAAGSA